VEKGKKSRFDPQLKILALIYFPKKTRWESLRPIFEKNGGAPPKGSKNPILPVDLDKTKQLGLKTAELFKKRGKTKRMLQWGIKHWAMGPWIVFFCG